MAVYQYIGAMIVAGKSQTDLGAYGQHRKVRIADHLVCGDYTHNDSES